MENSRVAAASIIKGGEMGKLIREKDWSATTLGPIDQWPAVLRTTLNILLNSRSPMFLFWGPDLLCFYNDAYRPSLGTQGKHPSALGRPAPEVWAEVWPYLQDQTAKVMAEGEASWNEDVLLPIYRNGQLEDVYWTFSYSPVFDEQSEPTGVFISVTETTEKVKTLRRIKESEQDLRNIILQAPVAMCILTGPEHVVDIANDRMFELWGKRKDAVLHKPVFEGVPEAKDQGFEALLDRVYQTGETFSAYSIPISLPRPGGMETVYINLVYEAFRDGNGAISGIMAVASEVTEQVMVTKKIEQSEASFRLLADSMPQFVWTGDTNGHLYYYNQAVYDYSGLTYQEIQKDGWLQIVHPDEREENIKQWMHAVQTGEDFAFHHRFRNKHGEYRWQLSRAVPQKDEAGHIQLWVGTSTDIHDQKLFEEELQTRVQERTAALEQANEALVRSNHELARSNANLEEFAHAASHDLKEPIRKVHFFADRLRTILSSRLNTEELRLFDRMETSVKRMGLLVDDLLTYSHVSSSPPVMADVNLNEKVQRVLDDLDLSIKEKKAVITVNGLPTIKGYPRQLQQLFQNIVSNALKYSKAGIVAEIHISSHLVKGGDVPFNLTAEQQHQSYHRIEVRDNGIGFEQGDAERIFQMFQRLHGKGEYPGTGVGLSIARKVVDNHHGFIAAISEPDKGATFHIYLPA